MAVLPDNDFRDSYRSLSGAVFKPHYALGKDEHLEYLAPQVSGLGASLRTFLRRSAFLHLVRQGIASLPVEGWLANVGAWRRQARKVRESALPRFRKIGTSTLQIRLSLGPMRIG